MNHASDMTPALLAELRAECKQSLVMHKPSELMLAILDLAEVGLQHAPPPEREQAPTIDWGERART